MNGQPVVIVEDGSTPPEAEQFVSFSQTTTVSSTTVLEVTTDLVIASTQPPGWHSDLPTA